MSSKRLLDPCEEDVDGSNDLIPMVPKVTDRRPKFLQANRRNF